LQSLQFKKSQVFFYTWLFFIVLLKTTNVASNPVSIKSLSEDPQWKALLHFKKNTFFITDHAFLISKSIDLEKELSYNIKQLHTDPNYFCRFPARAIWIKEKLHLDSISLDVNLCPKLKEFFNRAPAQKMSLVFASENLSSPSSMMGHTFLKISGKNNLNDTLEHAITYFTVLDTINPTSLIYRSLFEGMEGKFALLPYKTQLSKYRNEENRNVWEYNLNLSKNEQRLIYLHLWELKDKPSTYYFTKYNCATLTHFLLALKEPKLLDHDDLWITPSDVVKAVMKHDLATSKNLIPSSKWAVNLLKTKSHNSKIISHNLDSKNTNTPFENIPQDQITTFDKHFAKHYSNYLRTEDVLSFSEWHNNHKIISSKMKDSKIDLGDFKAPEKTPNDSQWETGFQHSNHSSHQLFFRIMPAAHTLNDDNRQYFTENELRLADIKISYKPEKQSLDLEYFTLYAAKTLTPRDSLTKGISGQWKIGIEKIHHDLNKTNHFVEISGGLGITIKPHYDVSLYSLINLGTWLNFDQNSFFIKPELGVIIQEIWNMKTLLNVSQTRPNNQPIQTQHSITQSFYLKKDLSFFLFANQHNLKNENNRSLGFSFTRYF